MAKANSTFVEKLRRTFHRKKSADTSGNMPPSAEEVAHPSHRGPNTKQIEETELQDSTSVIVENDKPVPNANGARRVVPPVPDQPVVLTHTTSNPEKPPQACKVPTLSGYAKMEGKHTPVVTAMSTPPPAHHGQVTKKHRYVNEGVAEKTPDASPVPKRTGTGKNAKLQQTVSPPSNEDNGPLHNYVNDPSKPKYQNVGAVLQEEGPDYENQSAFRKSGEQADTQELYENTKYPSAHDSSTNLSPANNNQEDYENWSSTKNLQK